MKGFMRGLKSLLVTTVVFLVLLEAGCFIAIKAGWFPVELPGYTLSGSGWFWRILSPDFGVWHEANDYMIHERQCFNVTYRSNSFGMRDAEVAKEADGHRVVVLGDSFVEGWGVEYGERFTELIERDKKVELLNFGTAGGFGSTQSFVLYKTLASKFSHTAVIFAVLPDNDFKEDEPPSGEVDSGGRWRPMLVGTYPNYQLTYPSPIFSPATRFDQRIEYFMEQFWITYRVVKYYHSYFKNMYKSYNDPRRPKGTAYAGYYDYNQEQFDRLRYSIEQIKALAGPRPMLVVTIPRQSDFRRAEGSLGEPPLRKDLAKLAADLGVTYFDLMIGMGETDNFDGYFHTCDGHWSSKGHTKAAEIVGKWNYFERLEDR